jgi:mono/diheme cytochrome c family protein
MRYIISILLVGAALGVIGFGTLGLPGKVSHLPPVEIYSDQYMPGMDKQPKLRPQKPDSFFANGITSQLPPEGTVARSQSFETTEGAVYPFEDSPVNTGHIAGGTNFVEVNPLPVDLALIQRGHDRFDIYCAPCHGRLGDGNGITKAIGAMPAVANLHDKRIVEMTDGEIFNTITHGKGLMGAAGPLVLTKDRWAIIAYLRALQLSQLAKVDDLTPEQQATLNK